MQISLSVYPSLWVLQRYSVASYKTQLTIIMEFPPFSQSFIVQTLHLEFIKPGLDPGLRHLFVNIHLGWTENLLAACNYVLAFLFLLWIALEVVD